jgi:hypothetical protein
VSSGRPGGGVGAAGADGRVAVGAARRERKARAKATGQACEAAARASGAGSGGGAGAAQDERQKQQKRAAAEEEWREAGNKSMGRLVRRPRRAASRRDGSSHVIISDIDAVPIPQTIDVVPNNFSVIRC